MMARPHRRYTVFNRNMYVYVSTVSFSLFPKLSDETRYAVACDHYYHACRRYTRPRISQTTSTPTQRERSTASFIKNSSLLCSILCTYDMMPIGSDRLLPRF